MVLSHARHLVENYKDAGIDPAKYTLSYDGLTVADTIVVAISGCLLLALTICSLLLWCRSVQWSRAIMAKASREPLLPMREVPRPPALHIPVKEAHCVAPPPEQTFHHLHYFMSSKSSIFPCRKRDEDQILHDISGKTFEWSMVSVSGAICSVAVALNLCFFPAIRLHSSW